MPSIQAPSLRLLILGVKHVPGGFPVKVVAVSGRGGGRFGCCPLGFCCSFLWEKFLRNEHLCWERECSQPENSNQNLPRFTPMCVLGDRPTLVKIFTRSCIPILYHSDHCSANASRVPLSQYLYLLHLLLGLGLFIPLLRQAFSNTWMTFKILLPQVGHIPICVCFADSAGPRGCCSILMNSLQAWMVLLTNIMYAVSIFTVHGSAQPSAGFACPWLRHRVSWVGLTQHPSHGFFYLLKALRLIIIILVAETYF